MAESQKSFIELGTVTVAHKAQKILETHSIKSATGKISSGGGCSWGVFVESKKRDEAALILRSSSVRIL